MNAKSLTAPRLAGALVFGTAFVAGLNFGRPTFPRAADPEEVGKDTHRTSRSARAPRAADVAAKRVATIRAATGPEARMLATLALAESIPVEDFGAWLNGNWFNLRGGPELMVFTQILMDRWLQEDPDGLLAWATTNRSQAKGIVFKKWAADEPERLISYFRNHRDDRTELALLAGIAVKSPDLALRRLKELADTALNLQMTDADQNLLAVLAEKSPAALEAMAASLPPDFKFKAEGALCQHRLEESFGDEIQRLFNQPDGWKLFSSIAGSAESLGSKMIGSLADLPPDWRSGLALQPQLLVKGSNARQWWHVDFDAAGFSSEDARIIRSEALNQLASVDPKLAVEYFADMDSSASQRQDFLRQLTTYCPDLEKIRSSIAELPTGQDRAEATKLLDQRTGGQEASRLKTPEEVIARISEGGGDVGSFVFSMGDWPPEKIAALTRGFQALPDDQKQKASQAVIASLMYGGPPPDFRDEAIRYFAANPPPVDMDTLDRPESKIYENVVKRAEQDPIGTGVWVQSLPAGEIKTWAQRNLILNWRQYDSKAAAAWEISLPAADRAALDKITTKR